MKRVLWALALFLMVLGCTPQKEKATENINEPEMIETYIKENLVGASKTESGMYFLTGKEGSGETPSQGDFVTVSYVGKFFDGEIFDQNGTFSFQVGVGRVIKGWDEALLNMKVGQRGTFVLPSELAYGERGAGGAIPPFTPLAFDIELFKIERR